MAIYFVKNNTIEGAPSDSNDGLDPIGFGLTTATYDDVGNGEGEHHLSDTGAFTSYSFTAGDVVYLSAGAGITPGLYEIASKVDNDAILLVNSAGSDSNGDVASSDGPFATLQKLFDTIIAGDDGIICGDANYETNAQIDIDTTGGSSSATTRIRGADARGVVDGTRPIIRPGASFPSSTPMFLFTVGLWYWAHIEFWGLANGGTDATNCVRNESGSGGIGNCYFTDCLFHEASGAGLAWGGTIESLGLRGCEIYGNGGGGVIRYTADARYSARIWNCKIHDNTGDGVQTGAVAGEIHHSEIYDNTGYGIWASAGADHLRIQHCTIFGNGDSGIAATETSALTQMTISECVITDNGDWGIELQTNTDDGLLFLGYNHSDNNTSGHFNKVDDADWANARDGFNQSGDPQFTSETDGSEDFHPVSGSPLIDAGMNSHIGALGPVAGGGGGSSIFRDPGMSGGFGQ